MSDNFPSDQAELKRLRKLKQIEHLGLSHCDLTDEGVDYLFLIKDRIKSLNIYSTKLSDYGLKVISQFTNLQSIRLTYTSKNYTGFSYLDKLVNIREIAIDVNENNNDKLSVIKRFHLLENLSLSGNNLNISGFSYISALKELRHLSLHVRREFNDLLGIVSNCNKLEILSIIQCELNDIGLSKISALNKVETLNLQETEISNEGLAYLTGYKNLKWLRLKENDQLNNSCIKHLSKLSNLQDLQIHETNIDQYGLEELSRSISPKQIMVYQWHNNFEFDFLLKLSAKWKGCTIAVKNRGEFLNGNFEGLWE